jgi:lipopolysaccharide transport protein LptA
MKIWSFLLVLFLSNGFLYAQEEGNLQIKTNAKDTIKYKEVEIIHADKLAFNTLADGAQIRKLVGNVSLKHDSTLMHCDSAYIYKVSNTVDAWGNIHIEENDSIHAYSKTLKYDGNLRKAQLIGDARIEDGSKTLYSEVLIYDMKNKKGYYNTDGRLEMDSTILISKKAVYDTKTKVAAFKYNVVITDPNYKLISDTLHYLTETKTAKFYGPTTIYNDSSTIDCVIGSYDTENEIATFGKGTVINNDPQKLFTDSLYYERFRGYGKTFYYFNWIDTEIEAGMEGSAAEYFENNQEIIAYDRPMLKVKQEEDTLFLKGDIIHTRENEISGEKEFWSFDNVRIFKTDFQGISDSLFYSFNDSLMRMYYDPLLWNEENQMEGDTVYVQLANDEIDQVHFVENSFVSMQSQGKLFDQIKGKIITGFFEEGKMKRMLSDKNAESLYFGKNDDGAFIGGNYVQSDQIMVYMENDEVDRITFIKKPEALFTPISRMSDADLYLRGFTWQSAMRPKGKWDL